MTPTDDADQPAPQPSPEDDAAVHRLLADARETGPVPSDVAARLDDALAGLVPLRTAEGAPAPEVVPLAPRRRRRAAALLVAAAAVVVGGVAIGSQKNGDDGAASPSADSAVSREGSDAEAAAPGGSGSGGGSAGRPESTKAARGSDMVTLKGAVPARVRPDHLVADVKALRRHWSRPLADSAYSADAPVAPHGFHCARAPYGHGVLLGVRYGDRPAVVAFRRPQGDTQVVEVLQCGTADVLRSASIPTH